MRKRTRTTLTPAAVGIVILVLMAASADAATISFLGSDETTATAWRTTTVTKSATYDPDGDNAYGTDGYYVTISGTGQDRPVTQSLPSYITSVTDKYVGGGGGRYNHGNYPDFDNPTLPIGASVADANAGIFYANEPGPVEIASFLLAQNAAFVLTIPLAGDNVAHRPTALSVTEVGGGGATDAAVVPTPASGDDVNYLFFSVAGSAGDTFRIDINGSASIHGIGGVGFEIIPEPSTFALAAVGLLGLMACGWRRR